MKNSFLDFLSSALIPKLSADISAGSSCDIHFVLIGVSAVRAVPDKLSVLILSYLHFAVISAYLTVIALSIKLGVHNMVINKLHYA